MAALRLHFVNLLLYYKAYKVDHKKLKSMKTELRAQEQNQIELSQQREVKQKEVEKREKILKLLPSGDENLQKLKVGFYSREFQ